MKRYFLFLSISALVFYFWAALDLHAAETAGGTLAGKVVDINGFGVKNIPVLAFSESGRSFSVKSGEKGDFKFSLMVGEWLVKAFPAAGSEYYNQDPAKTALVEAGRTEEVNFRVWPARALVSGTVEDIEGEKLSGISAPLFADLGNQAPFFLGSMKNGSFAFKAPIGSYKLILKLPPDSPYSAVAQPSITAEVGKENRVKILVRRNSSLISGFVADRWGTPITGIDADVYAYGRNGWQKGIFDPPSGRYQIRVAAGDWVVGADVDPAKGYSPAGSGAAVSVAENETVRKDIILRKADSFVNGRVTGPDNEVLEDVLVIFSRAPLFGSKELVSGNIFAAQTKTDRDGIYRAWLAEGDYYVSAVLPRSDLLGPIERKFSASAGVTGVFNLIFRSPDAELSGRVLLDGRSAEADVWAWSEKGGYRETRSDGAGYYSFSVKSGERWRVGAAKKIGRRPYRSSEILLNVDGKKAVQDLALSPLEYSLPKNQVQQFFGDSQPHVYLKNGAGLSLLFNSSSAGGAGLDKSAVDNDFALSVAADVGAPFRGAAKVIGAIYDMRSWDLGAAVSGNLKKKSLVEIPYYQEDLARFGVSDDNLNLVFWDAVNSLWWPARNQLIDKKRRMVGALADQPEKFALVAVGDLTPPEAPGKVKAVKSGGETALSWVNPAKDFHHIKVYRSEKKGTLGEIIFNNLKEPGQKDAIPASSTEYHYTIRSIDPAGNESVNFNQITAEPESLISKTASLIKNLIPKKK